MESLREIFEKNETERKNRRGSVFVTVLIILIIAFTAAFYIKTSKPILFEKAKACVMTVLDGFSDTPPPESAQGAVLRSADTFLKEDGYFAKI